MKEIAEVGSIGVFDSGLGGLTVVRQLRRQLPAESIIYLGDTARVPYGSRSPSTVVRYATSCANTLMQRRIKLLVVACNTASALAMDALSAQLPVAVIGVVEPGAKAAASAAEASAGSKVGVLATATTVASGAYIRAIAQVAPGVEVIQQPAPLLVPLVEEGWLQGTVPELAVDRYLEPLLAQGARVLVLGCTHYPLLRELIGERAERMVGQQVNVVDGAEVAARAVAQALAAGRASKSAAAASSAAKLQLMVTDLPGGFSEAASRFLGETVPPAEQVDILLS